MTVLATTKLSSKGQVVIPEEIRKEIGIKKGCPFIVMGQKDVIILKRIQPLSMDDFDDLIQKARKQAKIAGLKKSDVKEAILKVRARKRKK